MPEGRQSGRVGATYAEGYADRNAEDYRRLAEAARSGRAAASTVEG
jgi:hypothetical protein